MKPKLKMVGKDLSNNYYFYIDVNPDRYGDLYYIYFDGKTFRW